MIMCLYQFKHRRNLAGNIGGGGPKSTVGFRDFNLRRSQFRNRGDDRFATVPFVQTSLSPLSLHFVFVFSSSTQQPK